MTDASDRLLTDRFAALADPLDDSDWLDVRRRAGHRRSRARGLVPLAAALAALVAGSAFAFYGDVVDFGSAEKAPQETVEFFELFAVNPFPDMDPQAIASETRAIETTTSSGEKRVVYVAPTESGGLCFNWEHAGGGCDKLGTTPLAVSYAAARDPKTMTRKSWIEVHVSASYVASVELRFADGAVLRPPITWVSPPIDRGFFYYEHTAEQLDEGRRLTSVVALDDAGDVVSMQGPCCEDAAPPAEAIMSQKALAVSVPTQGGEAQLWTAPTRYDGTCAWLELKTQAELLECTPKGYESKWLTFRLHPTSETVLVYGDAPDDHRTIELGYADGDVQRVVRSGPYFVFEIPRGHLQHATRLVNVTSRDAQGRKIKFSTFDFEEPAPAGPCFDVLPLEPGQTCP